MSENQKLRVVVLENGMARAEIIEHTNEAFYKILGCDLFTMVTRNFNGKNYVAIVDDTGMITGRQATAVWAENVPGNNGPDVVETLFGPIILTVSDGDTVGSIPSEDIPGLIDMPMVDGITENGDVLPLFYYKGRSGR